MPRPINIAELMPGYHFRYLTGDGATLAPLCWTTHPRGAFRRQGRWFADVTQGRRPIYDGVVVWRVTVTPAILSDCPAKVGGDYYRHDQDGTVDLGEFRTYGRAIRAGDRWLAAQDRKAQQGEWVNRTGW
jgi:hypothetical protein